MPRKRNVYSLHRDGQMTLQALFEALTESRERNPGKAGQRLRQILEDHGLSQSEAARRIGISDRTVRRYIAGELVIPVWAAWAVTSVVATSGRHDDPQDG